MGQSRAACGMRWRHLKRRKPLTTPDKRDKRLKRLGFASYRDYLRSDLWKAIRVAKLELTPRCEICDSSRATQVHHLRYTYSCLKGKNPVPLVSACPECHKRLEFKRDGTKRTYEAAAKLTRRYLIKQGRWESHKHEKRRKCPADGE